MKRISTKFSSFWGKCLCLFSILIPCVALTANGQESFKPMLKDGRVWNCIEVYLGEEKNDTANREYRIEYASEIDGHVCYNLRLGSKPMGIYYEEGPKVFHYTASGWELLFDFSLSPGDVIPNSGGLVVDKVKTIMMKGVPRRCIYFPLTAEDGTQLCWIEGIGSSLSGPNDDNKVVTGSFLNVKLQSVYDGDVCIFEPDDFITKMVEINETTFPDEEFRSWVLRQSYGQDGVLTEEEIAGVTRIMVNTNGVQNLKGIEYFTSLTTLYCSAIHLTELDVSKCTKLEVLECDWNQLTSLDVSKNTALKELVCGANQLTTLDVSQNTLLNELHCFGNKLTSLDVSENIELTYLNCHENQLTALDLSKNTALKNVWCSRNILTTLNVSGCTKLRYLRCDGNRLTTLNVSGCPELEDIRCYSNQIKGEAMDALVAGLSTTSRGFLGVINYKDEQNVMTKSQVAAAKAKGWIPKYKNSNNQWQNYEGNDPIEPLVTFTAAQVATIILPTAPDASKGKYYRLDRCEEGQIIFEQELHPQAHTPYIIVPNEDFSIDPSTLDLAGLSNDTVSVGGVSFIGSYNSEELNEPEGFYIDIIDTTPDCGFSLSEETGKGAFIGALRAYLQVRWDGPYNPGGSKVPQEKMAVVLKDNGTGLTPGATLNDKGQMANDNWYDLQGRKIATGKSFPLKGLRGSIYIVNGRKVAR